MQAKQEKIDSTVSPVADYPKRKFTIVGGGIIGLLEAYFAHLDAKARGERLRVSIYEKNPFLEDTTTMHLVPSLTPDELLSVVPRGQELIEKLRSLFSSLGGIRVDDVDGVNESFAADEFKHAVAQYGLDEVGHHKRTELLLAFGKISMELWQDIYNHADDELKRIFLASNFNPCREPLGSEARHLHDGYRIDLIYNIPNAASKASAMKADYERLGYRNCSVLTPDEVLRIDPYLTDFCESNSELVADVRIWKNDAVAFWRPGGCLDTKVFLPLFLEYLKKAMGKYTNDAGEVKDCFQFRLNRKVEQIVYELKETDNSPNTIKGLKLFSKPEPKYNKHSYEQSDYVLCPGEAVGTLKALGLKEPEYARFAGASLLLNIEVPEEKLAEYAAFNHCMEVHQVGVVLAWQARIIGKMICIGVAGTKAFYGDQRPLEDQAFARDRNLLQLNMINDVLPQLISLALGKPTQGIRLTQEDLERLEAKGVAIRWAGSRAVAYDGFPTLGRVYNEMGAVSNGRCTTHLGSGGVSFGPASVVASRSAFFGAKVIPTELVEQVLGYGDSQRTYRA